MNWQLWIACALAGGAIIALVRERMSTRAARLKKLEDLINRSSKALEEQIEDNKRFRENELKLREANRKLNEALRLEQKRVDEKEEELKRLNRALGAQRLANEKLNEILGNQEEHVKRLERDLAMLKEQVTTLRAQLGLEP